MKFNTKKLMQLLNADTDELLGNPNKFWNFKIKKGKDFLYIDRGADILGIAHLDTVADGYKYDNKKRIVMKPSITDVGIDDKLITSIKLDDRLGVFLLMDVLPYLGLRYDILLTTNEEIGASTANNFTTKKSYNWMFEMDRRGYGTAVLYQYDTPKIKTALKSINYNIEHGTFSDVAVLDDLGCVGINFGCGYIDEHSNACSVRTSWLNVVVNMFVDFYNAYNDMMFEYVYTPTYAYDRYDTYGWYNGRDYGYKKGGSSTKKSYSGKTYDQVTSAEWTEILSDRYDEEEIDDDAAINAGLSATSITIVPASTSNQCEPEILPVDDDEYDLPPYYKNGIKVTAFRVEENGNWTAMGTDSNGDFYALGDANNDSITYGEPSTNEEADPSCDEYYDYLENDSRAKKPSDYLYPQDFDENVM